MPGESGAEYEMVGTKRARSPAVCVFATVLGQPRHTYSHMISCCLLCGQRRSTRACQHYWGASERPPEWRPAQLEVIRDTNGMLGMLSSPLDKSYRADFGLTIPAMLHVLMTSTSRRAGQGLVRLTSSHCASFSSASDEGVKVGESLELSLGFSCHEVPRIQQIPPLTLLHLLLIRQQELRRARRASNRRLRELCEGLDRGANTVWSNPVQGSDPRLSEEDAWLQLLLRQCRSKRKAWRMAASWRADTGEARGAGHSFNTTGPDRDEGQGTGSAHWWRRREFRGEAPGGQWRSQRGQTSLTQGDPGAADNFCGQGPHHPHARELAVLGMSPAHSLTRKALRLSFLEVARRWHPDLHPPDRRAAAEAQFKSAQAAYDKLVSLLPSS